MSTCGELLITLCPLDRLMMLIFCGADFSYIPWKQVLINHDPHPWLALPYDRQGLISLISLEVDSCVTVVVMLYLLPSRCHPSRCVTFLGICVARLTLLLLPNFLRSSKSPGMSRWSVYLHIIPVSMLDPLCFTLVCLSLYNNPVSISLF